jgi:hypothetical protein
MTYIQTLIEFFIQRKWLGILLVAGLATGIGFSTFYRAIVSPKQRTDLTVFLKAAEKVREGQAGQLYEAENSRHWRYVYAPPLAILLAPVSKWPVGVNVFLAYLFSIGCLAGTVLLTLKLPQTPRPAKTGRQDHASVPELSEFRPKAWQITLSMIFCLPIFMNTLTRGQFGMITLFFAAAILYSYLQRHKVLTGLFLAFAVALKISPLAYLVFFFLMKKEWRILASAFIGLFLFYILLPSLVIGFQQNWELLKTWKALMAIAQTDEARNSYLWAQLFTPFAGDNVSIYAVITRYVWRKEHYFAGHSNAVVRWVTTCVGFVLLTLPFLKTRKTSSVPSQNQDTLRSLAEFSLFPMLMLFTSPVTQIHHYTVAYFLFLAALLLIDQAPVGSWKRQFLIVSLWTCAITLLLGMTSPHLGYRGVPLWGSMLLWGSVLFCL